ncbi:TIGR03083 family protein [Lentzea xinjiangensis]|uniref:TIGR03083 family protein n=1 Tax=Lentzea xinjiangensis TaxID=402600 RepID=A0A1H9FAV0_9PSEU|nr:maleylpyruvate isomerase family mycothiol-dependent enzyme [Lentzea xinjiangensis]SEQ34438.1 TIGR03083 family protein [Lentzea xinjiangensis]
MIMKWLEAERLGVADLLEDLTDDEWRRETLCAGWTAQEMAAHLTTSTRTGWWDAVRGAVTSGFSFDRMGDRQARRIAARFTRSELIAQIRETAGSPKRAPGAAPIDPLVDFLVHGQDIARPLGRVRQMPLEPAEAALRHVMKSSFYGAAKRFRETGIPDLPVPDLLMLATGRKLSTAGDNAVGNSNMRSN